MLQILILAFIAITDPSTDSSIRAVNNGIDRRSGEDCSSFGNVAGSKLDEPGFSALLVSLPRLECPIHLKGTSILNNIEFSKLTYWTTDGNLIIRNNHKLQSIEVPQLINAYFKEIHICKNRALDKSSLSLLTKHAKKCDQASDEPAPKPVVPAESTEHHESGNGWILTVILSLVIIVLVAVITGTVLKWLKSRNIQDNWSPSILETGTPVEPSDIHRESPENVSNLILSSTTSLLEDTVEFLELPEILLVFHQTRINDRRICQELFVDSNRQESVQDRSSRTSVSDSIACQTVPQTSASHTLSSNISKPDSQIASTSSQMPLKSSSRARAFSPAASIVFGKFATTSLLPRDLLSSYKTKERRITPLARTIKDQILSAPPAFSAQPVVDEPGPSFSQVADVASYSQTAVSTEFDLNSFQFHKVLGQGSFGECLLGSHKQLGFVVAKLFLDHFRKPIQEAVEESPAHFYADSELKEGQEEEGDEKFGPSGKKLEEGQEENQPGSSGLGLKEEEKEIEREDTSRMELGKILMELEGEEDDDAELGGGIAGPSCSTRRDGNGEAYPSYIEENDGDFGFELEKKTEENMADGWKNDFGEQLEDADYETEEEDYFVGYEEERQFFWEKDMENNQNGSEIGGDLVDYGIEDEEEAIAGASYCWGTCLETIEEEDEEEDQTPGPSSCYSEDDSETVDSMNRWEEEEHRNNWENDLEMNQNLSEMDAEYASVYYEVKYEEGAAACSIYWYMKGAQDSQIGQELETDGQYYLEDEIASSSHYWRNLETIEEEEEEEEDEDEDEENEKIEEEKIEEEEDQKTGPSSSDSEDDSDYPSQLEYKGPSRREMEERELELSILLKGHTNIVKFYGLIYRESPEKIVGFVMEPLMGGDLHGTIFGHEELEEKLVNTWMVHLARAIAFLQKKCVIHRDIKPENILLTEDRRVLKLADFGYAKIKVAGQRNTIRITNLMYCAPEIYLDKEYTKMTDIYSYGMCLYAMFYRRKPYSRNLNMFSVETARYLQDNSTRPDLHGKLMDGLIASCWDGNPEKRPSIRQIVDKLDRQWRQLIPRYE